MENLPGMPVNQPEKPKFLEPGHGATKALAIFGVIAALALVSIGIIKIAPSIIRGIASAAVSISSVFLPAEKIAFDSNKYTIGSGEEFTLTWEREADAKGDGSYTLSYPCETGVHFELIQNGKAQVIFCNTSFNFLNENNSVKLVGYNTKSNSLEIPITLHFRKNGASSDTTTSVVSMTITKGATPSQPVNTDGQTGTQTGTQPRTGTRTERLYPIRIGSQGGVSNPNGYVDLTGRILEVGTVSTTTNVFTAKDKVRPDQRAAVRFEVINNGTKTSSEWAFAAVLPTFPSYIFQSEYQQPLAPGDRIQFTIGFDSIIRQSENTIKINIDNTNYVMEPNKDNNIVSGKIYVDLSN